MNRITYSLDITVSLTYKLKNNTDEGCSNNMAIAVHQDGEGGRCLMADV
jgi:hypothetical protein